MISFIIISSIIISSITNYPFIIISSITNSSITNYPYNIFFKKSSLYSLISCIYANFILFIVNNFYALIFMEIRNILIIILYIDKLILQSTYINFFITYITIYNPFLLLHILILLISISILLISISILL